MRSRNMVFVLALVSAALVGCPDNQEPNRRPELAHVTPQHTLRAYEVLRETITASDPDNNTITFLIVNNPGFVSIEDLSQQDGSATATLVIAPSAADVGTFQMTIRAQDSHGDSDGATCAVNVMEPAVATVTVSPGSATVAMGQTMELDARLLDVKGSTLSGREITWSSSAPAVATVDADGLVTGVAEGSATITASSEGKSGSAAITVPPNEPPTATIDSPVDGATFEEGETISFSGSGTDPEEGSLIEGALIWTSSIDGEIGWGESFARSDISVGDHTISLTAKDSQGGTGTDNVAISVTEPGPSIEWTDPSPSLNWYLLFSSQVHAYGYQYFAGTGGTGNVEFTASRKGASGTVQTTHSVVEGRGYRLKLHVLLSGRRTVYSSSEVCATFLFASPATPADTASIRLYARTAIGSIPPEYWCPTSYSLQELSVELGVATVSVSPSTATTIAGETQQFTATLRDADGNELSRRIEWSSSDDAVATVNRSGLATGIAAGTVTITARSEDQTGSAELTVETNSPPTAAIDSPADGATYEEGETITFSGSGSDPEEGILTGAALTWTSSIDGEIGTGESFTRSDLSVGDHTITLTAKDSQGATGTDAVAITVETNAPPTTTIDSPADGATYEAGDAIQFSGSGIDPEDGTLTGDALNWTSSVNGQIGTGESFVRSDLTVGEHTIILTATDSRGMTGSDTVWISVTVPGMSPELGYWQAPTDFGGFVFSVESGGGIFETTHRFKNYQCGELGPWEQTAGRKGALGTWTSNGELEIENSFNLSGDWIDILIDGVFDSGQHVVGTWLADTTTYGEPSGCSGSWEGGLATPLYLDYTGTSSDILHLTGVRPTNTWVMGFPSGATAEWKGVLSSPVEGGYYTFSLYLACGTSSGTGSFAVSLLSDDGSGPRELASTTFDVPYSEYYELFADVLQGETGVGDGETLILRVTFNGPQDMEPGELLFGYRSPGFESRVFVGGDVSVSLPSGAPVAAAVARDGVTVRRYESKAPLRRDDEGKNRR